MESMLFNLLLGRVASKSPPVLVNDISPCLRISGNPRIPLAAVSRYICMVS
jgi:hypothetical protein